MGSGCDIVDVRSCRLVGGGGGVLRPGLDGLASDTGRLERGREILFCSSLVFVPGFIWLRRLARGGVGGFFNWEEGRLSETPLPSAS